MEEFIIKKIMAVILAVLILVPTVAFAQCSETGYMPEDNNFYISGNVPDGTEGDAITLLLRDSDGNIKYVNQYALDKNLKYCAKFKLREYNEDYSGKDQSLSSLVNITDTGITPSGKAAEKLPDFETIPPLTQMGVLQKKCDSDLVITKKSITDDKVSFKVHNYSNADITGYGIIACYNNKLEKVFSTKPITMYSNSETTIFEDYNVENYSLYDEVYVFLWKESLCPITEKSRVR